MHLCSGSDITRTQCKLAMQMERATMDGPAGDVS